MSIQQGFLYERNVAKALKKLNWVKPTYQPAGAKSDVPDLNLLINKREYGCELKKDLASSGSLVIHHGGNRRYRFGDVGDNDEKRFLLDIGNRAGVLLAIKRKWNYLPYIQQIRDKQWLLRVRKAGLGLLERYQTDLANMPDIKFDLPPTTISRYYNTKKTYYINVAPYGFFLLGSTDPAKLNDGISPKIPNWDANHTAFLRIRVQSKGVIRAAQQELRTGFPSAGGQGYQITMEIQFKTVKKSPYNIGPIIGNTANIDVKGIKLP